MSNNDTSRIPACFLAESAMAGTMPWDRIRPEQIFEPDRLAENPPCRRSEAEIRRVLRLLDEIETGEEAP